MSNITEVPFDPVEDGFYARTGPYNLSGELVHKYECVACHRHVFVASLTSDVLKLLEDHAVLCFEQP